MKKESKEPSQKDKVKDVEPSKLEEEQASTVTKQEKSVKPIEVYLMSNIVDIDIGIFK